tara:strand:+ start:118 stop:270 length:153 start_codon:yes stop_codon:yes gene_type:complete
VRVGFRYFLSFLGRPFEDTRFLFLFIDGKEKEKALFLFFLDRVYPKCLME